MAGLDTSPAGIVKAALRKLGVYSRRDVVDPDDMTEGREALAIMLDQWSIQQLTIPFYTHLSFALDETKRTYTIGPYGDFNTRRPVEIREAYVVDSVGTEYLVTITDVSGWIYCNASKDSVQGIPSFLYYEPSYPAGQIMLDCLPMAGYTLKLVVKLPWEIGTCCDETEDCSCAPICGTTPCDPDAEYTFEVDDPNDTCDDTCVLDLEGQMQTYVDTVCADGTTVQAGYLGVGNGLLTNLSGATVQEIETWRIICTNDAGSGNETWSVTGSVQGATAAATTGVAYDNSFIAFTITDGATDFVVGDEFIVVQSKPTCECGSFETDLTYAGNGNTYTVTAYPRPAIAPKPVVPGAVCATEFPPGYYKTLIYNLAMDLAPEYDMEPPQSVAYQAKMTLDQLKQSNADVPRMMVDPAVRMGNINRFFNIYGFK